MILKIVIIFAGFFLLFQLLTYILASIRCKKISNTHPFLYLIGYKNSVIYLGYKSDSSVSPVGLVPLVGGNCFDYDKVSRLSFGSRVHYKLKPSIKGRAFSVTLL